MRTTKTKSARRAEYSRLRQAGRFTGTIKGALAKWEQRQALLDAPQAPVRTVQTIPIGEEHERHIFETARVICPRVRNWNGARPTTSRKDSDVWVRANNHGRYSSRCTWTRYSYTPCVRSYGCVTATRLRAWIGHRSIYLRAPRGWVFGQDQHGLYVVRIAKQSHEIYRYHFTSDDLLQGSRALHQSSLAHERKQLAQAQAAKLDARRRKVARALGVLVGMRDSVRGGNCPGGTRSFASRHGLEGRWVPIEVLERIAARFHERAPDAVRIRRACDAAIARTVAAIDRGYSVIE